MAHIDIDITRRHATHSEGDVRGAWAVILAVWAVTVMLAIGLGRVGAASTCVVDAARCVEIAKWF